MKIFHIPSRYHIGTLAFGSLIIAIVQFIRMILEYVDQKLKKNRENEVRYIASLYSQCTDIDDNEKYKIIILYIILYHKLFITITYYTIHTMYNVMTHVHVFKHHKVAKFVMKCLQCCFWCLEKFLKFINRNAYIMVRCIYNWSVLHDVDYLG